MTNWLITVKSKSFPVLEFWPRRSRVRKLAWGPEKRYDNTVGSRSKLDLAYIAGFLDGDGSLMLQIKKRHDGKTRTRFMVTICFYQDNRHEEPLLWIKEVLGIGYVSRRNDGMTELRINGYAQVRQILKELLPYLRFKKKQGQALFEAVKILSNSKRATPLSRRQLESLVDLVLLIQQENYVTKRKKTRTELLSSLGLTP